MQPYEERILIDIYKDEELDVFGIFKKRRLAKELKEKSKARILERERARKHNLLFYKIMIRKLVDIYGKEGSIRYLKVLFRSPDTVSTGDSKCQ